MYKMFGLEEISENTKKWIISTVSAAIFLFIASPYVYALTQRFIAKPLGVSFLEAGLQPTRMGLFVHSLVFLVIVRLLME